MLFLLLSLIVLSHCRPLHPMRLTRQDGALLNCGRVFDSLSGEYLIGPHTIVVEGANIVSVLPTNETTSERASVDLSNLTCLPGLADAHVHVLLHPYNETSWNNQVITEDIELRTIRAVNHLRDTLLAGFTTVRDLGTEGAGYADKSLKLALSQGLIVGPRFLISSRAIVSTGSYGPSGYANHVGIPIGAEEADGVEGVRKSVRTQLGNTGHADWIKLYGDYRRKPDDRSKSFPLFSQQEIEVAVQESAQVGAFVSVHASEPPAILQAVAAGAKSIEHGTSANSESLIAMRDKNVSLVPTLGAVYASYLYNPTEANWQRVLEARDTFQLALELGVPIVCGSDAGVFAHGKNSWELELMVEFGMSPREALRAATVLATRLIAPHLSLGVIEPAALADIIAVEGDPLNLFLHFAMSSL